MQVTQIKMQHNSENVPNTISLHVDLSKDSRVSVKIETENNLLRQSRTDWNTISAKSSCVNVLIKDIQPCV